MSRPSDHIETAPDPEARSRAAAQGPLGWLTFFWRQLTSMRVALLLLLLLAVAAIPGSLLPQRSSDPNGVSQWEVNNPDLFPILDAFPINAFDVYSSAWFSAIYILLFVSLIGCVLPRTLHHWRALRSRPPKTPTRLNRLPGFTEAEFADTTAATAVDEAATILRRQRYRVERFSGRAGEESVSAERGYLRETGNLVFHASLVGVLVAVGIGGGFGFSGQKIIVEGETFVNALLDYDSFNPGRFFDERTLAPYALTLDELEVTYVTPDDTEHLNALGQPTDFVAGVTVVPPGGGEPQDGQVRVNEPLRTYGNDVFLLGNGYAPRITVRDPDGEVVFTEAVPFLPQDSNLTSVGVVKVPDGLSEQVGLVGFFYPTQVEGESGAFFSSYPDLVNPVLTLNVFTGDLGINEGVPRSVYVLDTADMERLTGGETGVESIALAPGETVDLPEGLGSVSLEDVPRFVSFDIHSDPSQGWVLVFAVLAVAGLLASLLVPRRRLWVKAVPEAGGGVRVEYAALARGDDPTLERAVADLTRAHRMALGGPVEFVDAGSR